MLKSSFIADAATMPLHWFYDQNALIDKVPNGKAAFFSPPSCPFYVYPEGVFSPYGAESLPILRSLATHNEYKHDETAEEMYQYYLGYPDVNVNGYAGRLNHAPKAFTEARKEGKSWAESSQNDWQANGLAKVPLIVARYAGHADLLDKVRSMVGILQNAPLSADASALYAKILEKAVLHPTHPRDVIAEVLKGDSSLTLFERNILTFVSSDEKIKEWLKFTFRVATIPLGEGENVFSRTGLTSKVLAELLDSEDLNVDAALNRTAGDNAVLLKAKDVSPTSRDIEPTLNQVAASIGLSCNLPGALIVSLYVARQAADLTEAVNLNIMAGGDNCSRGMVIGALFGAWRDEVPSEWEAAMSPALWSEVLEAAQQVEAARK